MKIDDLERMIRFYLLARCVTVTPYRWIWTEGINRHKKDLHLKMKTFECPKCNKCFSQKSSIEKHTKVVHDKIRDYACSFCDFTSSRRDMLVIHQKFDCIEKLK